MQNRAATLYCACKTYIAVCTNYITKDTASPNHKIKLNAKYPHSIFAAVSQRSQDGKKKNMVLSNHHQAITRDNHFKINLKKISLNIDLTTEVNLHKVHK